MALLSAKDSPKVEPQSVPTAAAVEKDVLLPPEGAIRTEEGEAEDSKLLKNNLTEDKEGELMGLHEEGAKTEGNEFVFLDFCICFLYHLASKGCHSFYYTIYCSIKNRQISKIISLVD